MKEGRPGGRKPQEKSIKEDWTAEVEESFVQIKKSLTAAVPLACPDPKRVSRLVTEATEVAVGGVLEQFFDDGHWRPIGFFSRSLTKPEILYSKYDKELLAIKLAITHFRNLIEGLDRSLFHVATEYKPIVESESKALTNKDKRIWLFISSVTEDIRHLGRDKAGTLPSPGVGPVVTPPRVDQAGEEGEEMPPEATVAAVRDAVFSELAKAQIDAGWVEQPFLVDELQEEEAYVTMGAHRVRADISNPNAVRLSVPPPMTKKIFQVIHGISHSGTLATQDLVAAHYIWPRMQSDIVDWVRECPDCQAEKFNIECKTQDRPLPKTLGKFNEIHVDLVGPLPLSRGYKYVLTVVDRLTRWPVAVPLPDITPATCARGLLEGWIQNYGVPTSLVTDRGQQFTGDLWRELMEILGTTHTNRTSYHSNWMEERFRRQLKDCLRAKLSDERWTTDLPLIMLSVRAAQREDVGASSAEMVFGETLALPGGLFLPPSANSDVDYLKSIRASMARNQVVEPNWHGNRADEQSLRALETCDMVYVRVDSVKRPLQQPYKGPYKVMRRGHSTFTVLLPTGEEETVCCDRLKPAFLDSDVMSPLKGLSYTHSLPARPPSALNMMAAGSTALAEEVTIDREATLRLFNSRLDPAELELGDAEDAEDQDFLEDSELLDLWTPLKKSNE